jgi:Carlavirus putative nucleic acid binding protein
VVLQEGVEAAADGLGGQIDKMRHRAAAGDRHGQLVREARVMGSPPGRVLAYTRCGTSPGSTPKRIDQRIQEVAHVLAIADAGSGDVLAAEVVAAVERDGGEEAHLARANPKGSSVWARDRRASSLRRCRRCGSNDVRHLAVVRAACHRARHTDRTLLLSKI